MLQSHLQPGTDRHELRTHLRESCLPYLQLPGATLAPVGAVAVFAPWIKKKAGALCSEITPAVIASLYSVENGFKYGPDTDISPEGGRGPGRFTTAAWTAYGKDGDGDGKMDILGVADPVMTTGYRLCDLVKQAQSWQKSGEVEGDTVDLALAAYDVGPDAVREAGGVPADKSGEVPAEQAVAAPFVAQIKSLQDSFALMLAPSTTTTSPQRWAASSRPV